VAEIAQHLGRSKAWVSLRLGLLPEMEAFAKTYGFPFLCHVFIRGTNAGKNVRWPIAL